MRSQRISSKTSADLPAFAADFPSAPFWNNVPDPVLSKDELPTFKFELEKSEGRVDGGEYQAIDLSEWIAGNPDYLLEAHFGQTAEVVGAFPRGDLFITSDRG